MHSVNLTESERFLIIFALASTSIRKFQAPPDPQPADAHELLSRLVLPIFANASAASAAPKSEKSGTAAAEALLAPPVPADSEPFMCTPTAAAKSGDRMIVSYTGAVKSGPTLSCWDPKLFAAVSARVTKPTTFYVKRIVKGDKTYLNIVGIKA